MTAYLAPADVAARLSCSTDTVLRAVHAGHLRAVKYGRLVRIAPDEVDRWIDAYTTADELTPRRHRNRRTA